MFSQTIENAMVAANAVASASEEKKRTEKTVTIVMPMRTHYSPSFFEAAMIEANHACALLTKTHDPLPVLPARTMRMSLGDD